VSSEGVTNLVEAMSLLTRAQAEMEEAVRLYPKKLYRQFKLKVEEAIASGGALHRGDDSAHLG
jgi:hypothetical protein